MSTLQNITILPAQKIPNYAYSRKKEIESLTACEGVTSIGMNAFEGCTSLCQAELPESLMYIGREAFKGCSALSRVNIPRKVTRLNDGCFEGCGVIEEIELHEKLICGRNVFRGSKVKRLKVGKVSIFSAEGIEEACIYKVINFVRYRVLTGNYFSLPIKAQLMAEIYLLYGESCAKKYISEHTENVFEQLILSKRNDLLFQLADRGGEFITESNVDLLINLAIASQMHELYIMLTEFRHANIGEMSVLDRFEL